MTAQELPAPADSLFKQFPASKKTGPDTVFLLTPCPSIGYVWPMPRKTALRLHLDDDLALWLRTEAARRRSSVSQVMRDLVIAAMAAQVEAAAKPILADQGATQ